MCAKNKMTQAVKILLAEDDDQLRNLIATFLRHENHDVTTVSNSFEALDALKESSFDLLVSDIVMLGMDGIELALIASQERPEIKIILLSGYEEERARAVNLDSLIHGLLSKPFTLAELKETILGALDGSGKIYGPGSGTPKTTMA